MTRFDASKIDTYTLRYVAEWMDNSLGMLTWEQSDAFIEFAHALIDKAEELDAARGLL